MSLGGSKTTTVNNNDPWAGVQPYLSSMYQRTDALGQNTLPYFPDQTYADLNPLQQQAQQGLLGYSNTLGPQASNYMNSLQGYMDAPLNPASNPAVMAMMGANQQNATDWLTRDALPAIRTGAVAAGQLGGSRQGISEGLAIGEGAKALANANAQTMLGAYGTSANLAGIGANAMPNAFNLGMMPYNIQNQVGGIQQSYDQKGIDEAMARYYYPEQSQWDALNRMSSIYSGAANYGSQTQTQKQKDDPLTTILGTAATFAPFFMSDRRLKKNIKPLGSHKGYEWYEFEYKDEKHGKGKFIGVMADEVEKINPAAVATVNGYKAVNYGAL